MGNWFVKQVIGSFLRKFREMPNRGAGSYLEQKSAVIIKDFSRSNFNVEPDYQPLAIDISSGAWNTALHSIFFLISSVGLTLLGYFSFKFLASPAAQTVRLLFFELPATIHLGFFEVSTIYPLLSVIFCLLIIISRFTAPYTGWSLFSFFIPNVESGNVICRPKSAGSGRKTRLIIFSAHYDTARCLPRTGPGCFGRIARRVAKNGLSLWPTIGSIIIFLVFLIYLIFIPPQWLSIVLVIVGLLALVLIAVEAFISIQSSNLPLNPGFNDNLSGVGVLTGIMAENFPNTNPSTDPSGSRCVPQEGAAAIRTAPRKRTFEKTDFRFVFTGSEENGLRGSAEFRATALKELEKDYGRDNIYIINIDTVSGKYLRIFRKEKDSAGMTRGGNEEFINLAAEFINVTHFEESHLKDYFTDAEIARHFSKTNAGYALKLDIDRTFIQSSTDMSAICSCCDRTRNIITITGRDAEDEFIPRDYHQLTDTYEKMCEGNGEYISPIYFLAFALSEFSDYIDKH